MLNSAAFEITEQGHLALVSSARRASDGIMKPQPGSGPAEPESYPSSTLSALGIGPCLLTEHQGCGCACALGFL